METRSRRRTSKKMQISRSSLWLALLASLLLSQLDLASSWHFFDQTEPRPFGALHSSALSLPINAPANQAPDVAVSQPPAAPTGVQLVADLVQKSLDAVAATNQSAESIAPSANPSLAGKILNVLTSEPAKNATSQVLQTLKPRHKQVRDQAQHIEQHIINQHATSLSSQRLLPTKQRDQKLTSSLLWSGSNSDGRDSSPFYSIFDSFKSGVSSRSSIVKAISDNKLARTLSEMGKSLSGNKVVAGAALASTLAALGIVSKLLSPYLFAGGSYSKLGLDPLMGSDSVLRGSLTNYPTASTDRNFLYANPGPTDLMLAAATQNNPSQMRSQINNAFSQMNANNEFTFDPSATFDSSQQQAYYPTSALPGQMQFQPSKSNDPQVYLSYTTRPASGAYLQGKQPTNGDTNGHYSDFYTSNSPDQQAAASGNKLEFSYPSQNLFQPARYAQSAGEQSQESQGSPNYELVSPGSPILVQSKRAQNNFDSNGRRSGSVSLKMDPATKTRLYQQLQKQYQQQQAPQLMSFDPIINADSSNSNAAIFVPISAGLYPARAEKSSRVEQSGAESQNSMKRQSQYQPIKSSTISASSNVKPKKTDDNNNNNRPKPIQAQEANNESAAWKPSQDQTLTQSQSQSRQVGWQSVGVSKASLSKQMSQPATDQSAPEEQAKEQKNGDKNVNGAEQELLLRVSRTPASKASGVRVRSHIGSPSMDHESLPTFDGSPGRAVGEEGVAVSGDKQAAVTQHRPSIVLIPQQQQQVSDSKTNLIQLNGDSDGEDGANNNNNNNNNVKLIEANTKSGDKLTSGFESGLVAILPTGQATSIKHHNHNEEQQQDAARSGHIQSATGDGSSADKQQQQQQSESESGGKSLLLGQDEFGDMMTAYGDH